MAHEKNLYVLSYEEMIEKNLSLIGEEETSYSSWIKTEALYSGRSLEDEEWN